MGGQIKVIVAVARCREALCCLGRTRLKVEEVHVGVMTLCVQYQRGQ